MLQLAKVLHVDLFHSQQRDSEACYDIGNHGDGSAAQSKANGSRPVSTPACPRQRRAVLALHGRIGASLGRCTAFPRGALMCKEGS